MIKYILKRLLQLIPILIGITFLSFAMMRLAGGDAVTYMYENAGSAVSQEVIDETRKEYGLDQPFLVQYAKWFAGMATGDMGKSYVSKRDVYETFTEKLPATIMLTVSSVLLTMLIAIPFGILSAVKHNKWIDYLIRFFSFIGNSMPNFFAALVLMYFFSIRLGWLPVITSDNVALSLVLPTLTLAISMASKYTRAGRYDGVHELLGLFAAVPARACAPLRRFWTSLPRNPLKCEYFVPSIVDAQLRAGTADVTMLHTNDAWRGGSVSRRLAGCGRGAARAARRGQVPGQHLVSAAQREPLRRVLADTPAGDFPAGAFL